MVKSDMNSEEKAKGNKGRLTEQQVSEIAHDVSKDLNLHDIYKKLISIL